jgi:hypothetical protein
VAHRRVAHRRAARKPGQPDIEAEVVAEQLARAFVVHTQFVALYLLIQQALEGRRGLADLAALCPSWKDWVGEACFGLTMVPGALPNRRDVHCDVIQCVATGQFAGLGWEALTGIVRLGWEAPTLSALGLLACCGVADH